MSSASFAQPLPLYAWVGFTAPGFNIEDFERLITWACYVNALLKRDREFWQKCSVLLEITKMNLYRKCIKVYSVLLNRRPNFNPHEALAYIISNQLKQYTTVECLSNFDIRSNLAVYNLLFCPKMTAQIVIRRNVQHSFDEALPIGFFLPT